MRTKTMSPERADAFRETLRKLINERFDGKVVPASKRLGLSHSIIYEVLEGTRGPGMKVIEKVAAFTGQTLDELLGLPGRTVLPSMLGARDDFRASRAEIETRNARAVRPVPANVLDEVATFQTSSPPERITPEYVLRLCDAVIQGREDSWRDETAELRERAKHERTKR